MVKYIQNIKTHSRKDPLFTDTVDTMAQCSSTNMPNYLFSGIQ